MSYDEKIAILAVVLALTALVAVIFAGRRQALAAAWAGAWVLGFGGVVWWLVDHALREHGGLADALRPAVQSIGRGFYSIDPRLAGDVGPFALTLGAGAVLPAALFAVTWLWSLRADIERRVRGSAVATAAPAALILPRRRAGIHIARVPLAEHLEARGIAMVGAPGTGKTQAILAILRTARERGDRCIIVDSAGDIMSRLHAPGDTILAPGDARSVAWSPYADLRDVSESETLAASLIPPGHGSGIEWHGYARTLVSAVLRRTLERDETTTGQLLHYLTTGPAEELDALVQGLPASRLTAPGADKMLSSVLGIVGTHVSGMQHLDPAASADGWSLRDWAERGAGWLWMPYVDSAAEATRSLRRTWLDVLVRGIFDSPPDSGRRTWLILDELHAHGQLEILTAAAARGRKYGLRIVLGYQTASQIREVYGRDGAESIMGCTGHALILRSPDPDTADRLSRAIGEVEQERVQHSRSSSSNTNPTAGGSSSESSTVVREVRRAVLPSEIQALPDLEGYLILAGTGICRVCVPIVQGLERRTPALVRAAAPAPLAKPAPAIANAPVAPAPDLEDAVAVPTGLASLFDDEDAADGGTA